MSRRGEFKKGLKEFYNPNWNDVFKLYEKIHPPEPEVGDYVTRVRAGSVEISIVTKKELDRIHTTSGIFLNTVIFHRSTPEEIKVYKNRIE